MKLEVNGSLFFAERTSLKQIFFSAFDQLYHINLFLKRGQLQIIDQVKSKVKRGNIELIVGQIHSTFDMDVFILSQLHYNGLV